MNAISCGESVSAILLNGLELVSSVDIEIVDGTGEIVFLSEDPYLVFTPTCLVQERASFAFINLHTTQIGERASGRFYLDYGAGFNEQQVIDYAYTSRMRTRLVVFRFPDLRFIRWDPDSIAGRARFQSLTMGNLPAAEIGHCDRVVFDSDFYLGAQGDVRNADLNPVSHFLEHGWREGRSPSRHASESAIFDLMKALGFDNAVPGHATGIRYRNGATMPLKVSSFQQAVNRENPKRGLLWIGYIEAALGLGESARGMVRALEASSLRTAIYPFNQDVIGRFSGYFRPDLYDQFYCYSVNVFEMAPNQLQQAWNEIGPWRTRDAHNVYRAYWELPRAPAAWRAVLSLVDEIWAPTRFVADAFAELFAKDIVIVPPLVDVQRSERFARAHFALDDNAFYFIFTFDLFSTSARKNPWAVVLAFAQAFAGNDRVGLVIKYSGPPEIEEAIVSDLFDAAAADARIRIFGQHMPRDEFVSLIDCCDCYISLHRSEGFGLAMAEAMALGKPVIATDFSGSVDFLDQTTGFPVEYELRPVADGEYTMAEGQLWAEPSQRSACEQMGLVFRDEATRERRAAAGRTHVEANFGADAVRRAIEARATSILDRHAPDHRAIATAQPMATR